MESNAQATIEYWMARGAEYQTDWSIFPPVNPVRHDDIEFPAFYFWLGRNLFR
jgi:hypothetical protein